MNESFKIASVITNARHDFRRVWRGLIVFDAAFKLIESWLLVPAITLVLTIILSRAGHVAVSNREIVDFLLSPSGVLYAGLFTTVALTLLLLEQAAILLVADAGTISRPTILSALKPMVRVVELGAIQVILVALMAVPFVLLTLLTYVLLLSSHDINYYLHDRPPVFWVALGVGITLLLSALVTGLYLYVRWSLALPILLFEKQSARAALRVSSDRVRGVAGRIALLLIGWQVAALVVGFALQAAYRILAAALLDRAGEFPVGLILILLAGQGIMLATLSFLTVVGQGLLTRQIYLQRISQIGQVTTPTPPVNPESSGPSSGHPSLLSSVAVVICLGLLLLAPLALWADLPNYLKQRPLARVTAHRGHSRAAPENTLSAMRKAISSGADYAELDVQLTADGVVVLLHDSDLKRVAGVSQRISEITYQEALRLDVGSFFSPAFVNERIPKLTEVIELVRGKMRLNIELKVEDPGGKLAAAVANLIHEEHFESECLVTSFDLGALLELKRLNPRLRIGHIIAKSLGDVSRLEVDALSVRDEALTDDMLHAAHRRGLEVHVWTVNNPRQMSRFLKRGVDNMITDDPDVLLAIREEMANLSGQERLVLASRFLLGLDH